MSLKVGARLGQYEITGPLGAGGMGEVYRATDSKLDREVAIKVLPGHLTEDPFSLERFEREAKVIAALSHPAIVRIFDFGREGEVLYSVMELLEGETLRQYSKGRPLPVTKAVELAVELAKGLAAAHDKNIVHRDLKPDNVIVTNDGRIKILDFGLAKSTFLEGVDADAPTAAVSAPGALFGTIEYMSPEQVRGKPADHRSDIFALGVVLYEMLVGHRPFRGDSVADTMSAILSQDPEPFDMGARPLPPALGQILTHCLEKRPEDRFRSAHDLAFALTAVPVGRTSTISPSVAGSLTAAMPHGRPEHRRALWLIGLPLLLAIAFGVGRLTGPGPAATTATSTVTFEQLTFRADIERTPSLGPNGRAFVYTAFEGTHLDVFLQRVGGSKPINLTADSPEDDSAPAISPDGESVVFRSERGGGGLFTMGATGESVRRLTDFGHDPDWSPDGAKIVFATERTDDPLSRMTTSELWVLDVASGERTKIYEGDAVSPAWSPNGHRIAFWATPGSTGQRDILTIPSGGGTATVVTDDAWVDWSPAWGENGETLYFASDRGGTMNVWQVGIDERSGAVAGAPTAMTVPAGWAGSLDTTADGRHLAFATKTRTSTLYRASFDPERMRISGAQAPILSGSVDIGTIALSPDGETIAFVTSGTQEDVYTVGIDGTDVRQLTDDAYRDRGVRWHPSGEMISFYSNRSGRYEVWTIHPDGAELVQVTDGYRDGVWYPTWAPDGSRLAINNGAETWIFEPDALAPADTIEALPPMDGPAVFQASSWSADGETIAGFGFLEGSGPQHGLFAYSFTDGTYETLAEYGKHPIWAGPEQLLIWWEGSLALFDVESRTSTTLLHDVFDAREQVWRNPYDISADGRTLVYLDIRVTGDLWLARLAHDEDVEP